MNKGKANEEFILFIVWQPLTKYVDLEEQNNELNQKSEANTINNSLGKDEESSKNNYH